MVAGEGPKGEKSQREMLNLPITTSIFFPFPDDPPYPSSQFFFYLQSNFLITENNLPCTCFPASHRAFSFG